MLFFPLFKPFTGMNLWLSYLIYIQNFSVLLLYCYLVLAIVFNTTCYACETSLSSWIFNLPAITFFFLSSSVHLTNVAVNKTAFLVNWPISKPLQTGHTGCVYSVRVKWGYCITSSRDPDSSLRCHMHGSKIGHKTTCRQSYGHHHAVLQLQHRLCEHKQAGEQQQPPGSTQASGVSSLLLQTNLLIFRALLEINRPGKKTYQLQIIHVLHTKYKCIRKHLHDQV